MIHKKALELQLGDCLIDQKGDALHAQCFVIDLRDSDLPNHVRVFLSTGAIIDLRKDSSVMVIEGASAKQLGKGYRYEYRKVVDVKVKDLVLTSINMGRGLPHHLPLPVRDVEYLNETVVFTLGDKLPIIDFLKMVEPLDGEVLVVVKVKENA